MWGIHKADEVDMVSDLLECTDKERGKYNAIKEVKTKHFNWR